MRVIRYHEKEEKVFRNMVDAVNSVYNRRDTNHLTTDQIKMFITNAIETGEYWPIYSIYTWDILD